MISGGFSKGQSSVEFLSIVGIALVISAPFFVGAQQSVLDIEQASKSVSLEISLDKLEEAVSTVSVSGEPSRRTFYMDLPNNVVNAQVVKGKAVVYTVRTRSGLSNRSRIFDIPISAPKGLPNSTGGSRISVVAWKNQVNITVVD